MALALFRFGQRSGGVAALLRLFAAFRAEIAPAGAVSPLEDASSSGSVEVTAYSHTHPPGGYELQTRIILQVIVVCKVQHR